MRNFIPEMLRRCSLVNVMKCSLTLAVVGLFVLQAGQGPELAKFERPIMMDSNGPGSQLFVLDSWGTLHEFRVTKNSLEEYQSISLPPKLAAADMTYTAAGGQESVLIAGTLMGRGIVARYALDGKQLQTWSFRNICSGIDFDAGSNTAYVATSDSNEIYQLNVRGTESKYVARIPNATKLGPLAFDEGSQRVFVADVAAGAIYQYSLSTRASKVLVSNLSAPTALSFDSQTRRLYIADPGRRGIFTVDMRSNQPLATEFVSDPLKSPYGMALLTSDRMAVADYGANGVLVFSSKAELLFRFPRKN
jgi:DNA-binding beta-propeller fold protein YncE